MADKLWDLANLLTGFAVAQALAMVFGLMKTEFKLMQPPEADKRAYWSLVGFVAFYILGVTLCGWKGSALDAQTPSIRWIWSWVTGARVIAIVFFNSLLAFTIMGHRQYLSALATRRATPGKRPEGFL